MSVPETPATEQPAAPAGVTDKSSYRDFANARNAGQSVTAAVPEDAQPASVDAGETPNPDAVQDTTEVEAAPAETTDQEHETPASETPARQKKKRDPEKRIAEVVAQRNIERDARTAAEKQLAEAKAELERLKAAGAAPAEVKQAEAAASAAADATGKTPEAQAEWQKYKSLPDAPQIGDFDEHEDFLFATAAFVARKQQEERDAAARDASSRDAAKRAHEQRLEQHQKRIEAARSEYDDFDEVCGNDELAISEPMANVIVNHELGPHVAYFLGTHPDEAARIAAIPDRALAYVEMGQLVSRVAAERSSGPARHAAPVDGHEPIQPVGGGPSAPAVPLEKRTYRDYANARNAEEERKRQGR